MQNLFKIFRNVIDGFNSTNEIKIMFHTIKYKSNILKNVSVNLTQYVLEYI